MSVATVLRAPLALTLCALGATSVHAQQGGAFAYPNAGQSEQQQSKDRYECHQWAVSQTGFDPSTAPPLATAPPPAGGYASQPPPQASGGGFLGIGNGGMLPGRGVLGDAATGAALGAAGGAIAGNAGQGAAIGAVASTLFGAFNRATDKPAAPPPQQPQSDYYRQQQAAVSQEYNQRLQMTNDYNRAFGTCMGARNYTVN